MVKLYTTDSYFEIFTSLNSLLEKSAKEMASRNVVFSEAKVSLMIERNLVSKVGGSFNTDVYSFGKFLHVKKPIGKLLSKEGSAMAIKRILSQVKLNCFRLSAQSLAPSLFDLIIQLKSAGISPRDLDTEQKELPSVLKGKLDDVKKVFEEYENFIKDNGYDDQSSLLSYLPEIIRNDPEIKTADVYLVGYASFTAQAKAIVNALIDSAKSVTAIVCEGENEQVFVNETAAFIRNVCAAKRIPLSEKKVISKYTEEGRFIVDNAFLPHANKKQVAIDGENVYFLEAKNPIAEIERVAQVIKKAVASGKYRYRDVTIAVNDIAEYRDLIKAAFSPLGIPYYLDQKKKAGNHPLVNLICQFLDAKRKNFERSAVLAFLKNPFYGQDKRLFDEFEEYLYKYNINYGKITQPFTFGAAENDLEKLEAVRVDLINALSCKDVRKMLELLSVKEKVEALTVQLKDLSENEEAAVNEQIYDAATRILDEMDLLLDDQNLSVNEYKSVFMGGVSALELSIIPQYNDAVFVGGYKEVALAKAKMLFAVGLTSAVPAIKQDVAILSDGDLTALEQVKVLIEPKISVVNHRARENAALALAAFSDRLYLSYPVYSIEGGKNTRSEIIDVLEKSMSFGQFPAYDGYVTESQGIRTFANQMGRFSEGDLNDVTDAWSFYKATESQLAKNVIESSNAELKVKLNSNRPLVSGQTSPTTIEDFYRCPYKSFLSHGLKLRPRQEERVDAISVGNVMHDVFRLYAKGLKDVFDEQSSEKVFFNAASEVLEKEEYKRFLSDPAMKATMDRVLSESKKYCYKTYLTLKKSKFIVKDVEEAFGDGKKYPAISLNGGKMRLKGKIDRIDESDNYYRIIDYKTGKADCSDKSLFSGLKLQLYLYAAAVESAFSGKQPAGLYYLPVSDKFEREDKPIPPMAVGKTLDQEQALFAQDENFFVNAQSDFAPTTLDKQGNLRGASSIDAIGDCVEYAKKISELAAKRMFEGVIVPSPAEGTCEYCGFKGLCPFDKVVERKVGEVDESVIEKSLGGKEDGRE